MDTTLPTVSVIIPIWNDAAHLRLSLNLLAGIGGIHEVIVADASTDSECRDVAAASGVRVVHCAEPSRGRQMNAAAAQASGDVLLFQHADTELRQAHIDALRRAMADGGVIGGAFYRRFNPHHRMRKCLEPLVRWINRGKRATLWGDQSMFVRREVFERMGGFAPIPLMEDMEFSRRLRRLARQEGARIELLDPPMWSSARRHKAYGSLRASVEIFCIVQLFKLGVSPERIHRHYYRRRKRRSQDGPPIEVDLSPSQASRSAVES